MEDQPLPESQNLPADQTETTSPGASFSWQASEFIHHEKRALWFVGLFLGMAGLGVLAWLTHSWTAIPLLVVVTIAVVIYGLKKPEIRSYTLNDDGLSIDHKFFPYSGFRSFAVVSDLAWHSIDLEPLQRFSPRLSVLFEDKDLDTIVGVLEQVLPRIDRRPDAVERLSRYLKF